MARLSLVAIAVAAEFHRLMARDGGVTVVKRPGQERGIIGAAPSSIIVDEVPPFEMPKPVSSIHGNPRPYLKRKKGRS